MRTRYRWPSLAIIDSTGGAQIRIAAPGGRTRRGSSSDDALAARMRAGDVRAFELLHTRYDGLALHVARRVLGPYANGAEDVVQEAFLAFWRNSEAFDPARGSVRAWLIAIVRHCAIDALRREQAEQRRRARVEALGRCTPEREPTADVLHDAEQAHVLRDAVENLPREQYRVIDLAYYLELSQSEIADLLDCPLGTVKARSRLGLAKLRATDGETA